MGSGAGRKKEDLEQLSLLRKTCQRLREKKREFRRINENKFHNMDDVINHIIDFMEKRIK